MDTTQTDLWTLITDAFDNTFIRILGIIVITLILQLISRAVIRAIVHSALKSRRSETKTDLRKREKTLIGILRTFTTVLLWTFATVSILGLFRINVSTLMTGAGVIGIVIGLGAQSFIRDLLAGFFIIMENQYRVGDVITLRFPGNEVTGTVEDLTVRITRLRDLDGSLHTIPNGISTMVTNQTFGFAQANIELSVDYGTDIEQLEAVINSVGVELQEDEQWAKGIIDPIKFVRVTGFGEKTVTVLAKGKVAPAKQWDIAGEFRRRLLLALKDAGISMVQVESTTIAKKKK